MFCSTHLQQTCLQPPPGITRSSSGMWRQARSPDPQTYRHRTVSLLERKWGTDGDHFSRQEVANMGCTAREARACCTRVIQGAKIASRVTWMGEHDRVATTGFSKMSDRQLGLMGYKSPKEPVGGFRNARCYLRSLHAFLGRRHAVSLLGWKRVAIILLA